MKSRLGFTDIRCRIAKLRDVMRLVALYERFYNEADYQSHTPYDPAAAVRHLVTSIGTENFIYIVAETDEGKLIGVVSVFLDTSCTAVPIGVVGELYVVPEHRRSDIGRGLMMLAGKITAGEGANVLHIPVASNTRAARSLANMLMKCGCEPIGYVMRMDLKGMEDRDGRESKGHEQSGGSISDAAGAGSA